VIFLQLRAPSRGPLVESGDYRRSEEKIVCGWVPEFSFDSFMQVERHREMWCAIRLARRVEGSSRKRRAELIGAVAA